VGFVSACFHVEGVQEFLTLWVKGLKEKGYKVLRWGEKKKKNLILGLGEVDIYNPSPLVTMVLLILLHL
jgi:hypothetical protein